MKRPRSFPRFSGLSLATILCFAGAAVGRGQYTQNKRAVELDTATYPAEVKAGYRLFRAKCDECHGLDKAMNPTLSPEGWSRELRRMQSMASAQFNDKQGTAIATFLNYEAAHRKKADPSGATSGTPGVASGRRFFEAQSCDTCHAIGSQGGTDGPNLTDVGARLSRDQLRQVVREMGSEKSSMAPLPAETTEQQIRDLIDYLATLKGE
jgi:mono/diheme cytochrome c family protein